MWIIRIYYLKALVIVIILSLLINTLLICYFRILYQTSTFVLT